MRRTDRTLRLGAFATLALALGAVSPAFGQTSQSRWFYGSGTQIFTNNTISASVFFTLTGGTDNNLATGSDNVLFADFANTTTSFSRNRGDLLNVLLFNLSSGLTPSTANGTSDVTASLWASSSVVNSANTSTPSQVVNGQWVFGNQNGDPDNRYKWGVSAAGYSNPGGAGNETYSFSGFSTSPTGGSSGGDNYSLIPSTATRNASNQFVNGSNIALIKGRVRLRIADTNMTNLSQITGVGFGYQSGAGATGYAILPGSQVTIPEPATGLLALLGLPLLRRRRR